MSRRRDARGAPKSSRLGHRLFGALSCCVALSGPAGAGSWCDVVFKDVVPYAERVVLARVRLEKRGPARLDVVGVLKGKQASQALSFDSEEFRDLRLGRRDLVLVALDGRGRLIRSTPGMGVCDAVSILPIRDGKLRARDRLNYDSLRGTITLDRLREQLSSDGSRQAASDR